MSTLRRRIDYRITADPSDFVRDVRRMRGEWRALSGELVVGGAGAGLRGAGAGIVALGGRARDAAVRGFGRLRAGINSAGGALLDFRTLAGGFLGFQFARSVMDATTQIEILRSQFTLFYGDATRGAQELERTLDFSEITPFTSEEMAQARVLLKAFGADSMRTLRAVSDAAAAVNRPIEQVVRAIGYLRAGVFGEGFESLRRLGISRQAIEQQGGRFGKGGEFLGTPQQAVQAAVMAMEQMFGGMSEQMAGTFANTLVNMRSRWRRSVAQMGEDWQELLQPKLEWFSNRLSEIIQMQKGPGPDANVLGERDIFDVFIKDREIAGQVSRTLRGGFGWIRAGMAGIGTLIGGGGLSGAAETVEQIRSSTYRANLRRMSNRELREAQAGGLGGIGENWHMIQEERDRRAGNVSIDNRTIINNGLPPSYVESGMAQLASTP